MIRSSDRNSNREGTKSVFHHMTKLIVAFLNFAKATKMVEKKTKDTECKICIFIANKHYSTRSDLLN